MRRTSLKLGFRGSCSVLLALLLVLALTSYRQAIAQDSNSHFAQGVANLKQENWERAISNFQKTLSTHPRDANALFYLSQAYYFDGQMKLALTTIGEVVTLEPNNGVARQKFGEYLCEESQCVKGLTMLKDARNLSPDLEHIDFDVGMAYYRLSNLNGATTNLRIAVRREPSDAEAAFFLAECYSIEPDWPRAEEMYQRALVDGKSDAPTHYGLGVALLRQNKPGLAIEEFNNALKADPSLVECHYQLARALRILGRNQEAQQELRIFKAVHETMDAPAALTRVTDPDKKAFWFACQRLLEQGQEKEVLKRLGSVNGGQQPYYLLGALYYSIGRYSDAKRAVVAALASQPQDSELLAWLGKAELAEGDIVSAEASFRQSLEAHPEGQVALAGMGAVRHAQGRWAESASWIERSKTREAGALLDLCDDYVKLGRMDDADLAADLIQSFDGGDKAVQMRLKKLLAKH